MIVLANNWWAFVLRGIFAVLFGVLTFFRPGMALLTLVFLFGIYAISDGVFSIIAAFRRTRDDEQPWWALLLSGVLSIIAGVIAFFLPPLAAMALLYLIAAWAIVTGIMAIVAAIRLRKQIEGEWLMVLSGVLSLLFGIFLITFPGAGALAVILWIGAYAFVLGIMLIVLGFRLRSFVRAVEHAPQGLHVAPGH
jgi:uncharacterized membrane protein HdeD (DUF308 family)